MAADDFTEWNTTGQGLFVDGPGNQLAWLRLLNNDTIFKQFADPSAGPTSAHYEMIFSVSQTRRRGVRVLRATDGAFRTALCRLLRALSPREAS